MVVGKLEVSVDVKRLACLFFIIYDQKIIVYQ